MKCIILKKYSIKYVKKYNNGKYTDEYNVWKIYFKPINQIKLNRSVNLIWFYFWKMLKTESNKTDKDIIDLDIFLTKNCYKPNQLHPYADMCVYDWIHSKI